MCQRKPSGRPTGRRVVRFFLDPREQAVPTELAGRPSATFLLLFTHYIVQHASKQQRQKQCKLHENGLVPYFTRHRRPFNGSPSSLPPYTALSLRTAGAQRPRNSAVPSLCEGSFFPANLVRLDSLTLLSP